MPYNYNDPRQYQFKPTKGQHAASGIGALIAAALAATQGQNTGDAIARGVAGAVSGYGGGMNAANQEYQDMFERTLGRDKFAQGQQEYEETDKPYKQTVTKAYEAMANQREMPKVPAEVQTWEYIQNIKNPRQRSEAANRMMPLKRDNQTNINVNTGEAEREEQKVIGRTMGESYQELQKDAQNARNEIDMFGTLKELSTQTETGKFEPFKTQLAGYAQALGAPINNKYNANQMFEAISNKLTVMARKVGEGQILAGQISDADREFLKRSVPELSKLPEANKMLIDWNLKLANRRIELAKQGEEYYNKNGTMKGFSEARTAWINQNPIFKAEQQPSTSQTMPKESALQELFDLAQKGDPEALEYFRSKGIK